MGYYSQWKLVAVGKPRQIERFYTWLISSARSESVDHRREVFQCLLDSWVPKPDRRIWLAEEDQCKCYSPWGTVIQEVLDYGRDVLKLDMAYAELGENMEDFQFDNGENLRICYERTLGEVLGLPTPRRKPVRK